MNLLRHYRNFVFALLISSACIKCNPSNKDSGKIKRDQTQYSYSVIRAGYPPQINSEWENGIWKKTKAITLQNYMGDKPSPFPLTKVKLCYDKDNIYVIFNVSDKYVKAIEKKTNGSVWFDSCVEFFFSPGPDVRRGYFNFETNCKGVFLFQYHTQNESIHGFVHPEDYEKIKISHSLERNVEMEITEPLEWRLEYSIPYSILKKYMKVENPGPGVRWRANFYKCADKTSHPHWLTWAFVDYPRPKFHLPEFFGWLYFE